MLRTERGFQVKQKAFFIIFKGRSVAKNYLRPGSAPLKGERWKTITKSKMN